jgi:ring-1,2-phenylacetyl-CoA epoxidase subunit PaaD
MVNANESIAWAALDAVVDPEIPMLSVTDLGIVRAVSVDDAGRSVAVDITPTYSGCPAIEQIEQSIRETLAARFASVSVRTVLAPAWTTDWMTERGKQRLREAGIAPPTGAAAINASATTTMQPLALLNDELPAPACPRCGSEHVERVSEYGSTACKSLWKCTSCLEPFDHFKSH